MTGDTVSGILFAHTVTQNNNTNKKMRTKTLLLAAAALAVSLVTSQAQSPVYSANIVGYAQTVIYGNGQYTLLANPFDDGNGDLLTNIVDSQNLLPKQSQVLVWDSVHATFFTIAKGGTPPTWGGSTNLPPGVGFFVRNGSVGSGAPNITNTFIGTVIVQTQGSVTNQIPVGYSMQGSVIPYVGNVCYNGQTGGDTNINYGASVNTKKSQILTWDQVNQTYDTAQEGGTPPLWNATVPISVGQGFFINNTGASSNVVQNADY